MLTYEPILEIYCVICFSKLLSKSAHLSLEYLNHTSLWIIVSHRLV